MAALQSEMKLKLGPCPWCGSPGHIAGGASVRNRGAQWRCDECGARGPRQRTDPEDELLPSQAASQAFWSVFPTECDRDSQGDLTDRAILKAMGLLPKEAADTVAFRMFNCPPHGMEVLGILSGMPSPRDFARDGYRGTPHIERLQRFLRELADAIEAV